MQYTKKLFITALLAAGSLLTSAVAAPLTLDVAADNWVSGDPGFQDKHYGGWDRLSVHASGNYGTKDRIPFFRFDLASYTGGTISGAELQLFPYEQFSSTPQDFTIYGISDGGASENFGEGATTQPAGSDPSVLQSWDNSGYAYGSGQSLSDSASFGDLVDLGTLSGVTNADIGSSVSFSSAALDDFLNNDGNDIATFLVYNTNGTGNIGGLRSKETDGTGTGNVTTLTLVPEPTSFVLLLGGFSLLIAAIRRRS